MVKELVNSVDKRNNMIICIINLYNGFPVSETVSAGAENGVSEWRELVEAETGDTAAYSTPPPSTPHHPPPPPTPNPPSRPRLPHHNLSLLSYHSP